MTLQVAFLWHMHQPYYVDTARQVALMPWVRLHATKGYLDMAWLVERFPEFHCTFNLTPVLLKQIEELANGEVRDLWHELATTPASDLTGEQKTDILAHFFKANWDNMIKPHPRYWALLHKRGLQVNPHQLSRLVGRLGEQDYRDLQAWFNLTWFGYAGERLHPEIAELKRKGQNFTEADKQIIFDAQHSVLRNLVGYYRALSERGQVEISTTPFFHPILPLVYNTEFAHRCMPGVKLPTMFSHPEDVRAQLQLARDYHTKLFGTPPRGLWPSEGSVCPELIPILKEQGFQWFATDEEILWRSLASSHPGRLLERNQLFQAYRAEFADAGIGAVFRERTLSDFIGFSAARNEPRRAAEFMVEQIFDIARQNTGEGALCPVILDGENAWEHFPDGGEAFLSELYHQLTASSLVRTTTFTQHFAEQSPRVTVHTLHTGSWIGGNFRIWIGHPEDNRGWELLGRTRAFLQDKYDRHEISEEKYQQALWEIYAAEGSDWFWWYGDDFSTENDLIFDELFRIHLQNVYRIVGAKIPDILNVHICRSEVSPEIRQPTALITPVIDGKLTTFYEWAGAGFYEAGKSMGAMYRAERLIQSIHFGTDLQTFFLRVDFLPTIKFPPNAVVRLAILAPQPKAILVSGLNGGATKVEIDESSTIPSGDHETKGWFDRVLEISAPFHRLDLQPRVPVNFVVQVMENDVELERHPEVGAFVFTIPDENFEVENWTV